MFAPHTRPQAAKLSLARYEVREGVGCSGHWSVAAGNDSLDDMEKSKLPPSITKKSTICSEIRDMVRLRLNIIIVVVSH